MFKHFLVLAIRNLRRNKGFTLINILGLTGGLATFLLLLSFVAFHWSFDDFHTNSDRIYRVVNDRFQKGTRVQKGTITYAAVGPQMAAEYPEIKRMTRVFPTWEIDLYTPANELIIEDEALYVDSNFFDLFDYELLAGTREQLLTGLHQVVITEDLASRYFGAVDNYQDLIGSELQIEQQTAPFTVQAICRNLPDNTYFQGYHLFMSYASGLSRFGPGIENSWTWSDFYHFLELQPGVDAATLEQKFPSFSEKHFRGEEVSGAEERFYLQPLAQVHLHSSDLEYEIGTTSNGSIVWAMLFIAVFILIIGWINYTNLATVSTIERAQEVGVRKVIGAGTLQLSTQFILEAIIVNLISLGFAFQLAALLQKPLSNWLDATFQLGYLTNFGFLLGGLIFLLFLLGLSISSFYPALLLPRRNLVRALKGQFSSTGSENYLRKGLIIFQFTASVALMAGTVIAFQQLSFINNKDLGFALQQNLIVEGPSQTNADSTFLNRVESFKDHLKQFPGIEGAATSSRVPGTNMGRIFGLRLNNDTENRNFTVNFINADHDYAAVYDLHPTAGRFFVRSDHNTNASLVNKVVINEAAVRQFGFESAEGALNQSVNFYERDWEIVGVLPDYHQRSLHHNIEPIILLPYYETFHDITVKLGQVRTAEAISHIESGYREYFPGNDFSYFFLDKYFDRQYRSEKSFSRTLIFFTILALSIACLGLFGLASYATLLRTKEIGIRKVLGASTGQIIDLLSRDFLKLVLVATLLATPLTWFLMQRWLSEFAFHINISWWTFLAVGLLSILVAFLTVGLRSFTAAAMNPVDSLRTE